jgi:hypothetical protein
MSMQDSKIDQKPSQWQCRWSIDTAVLRCEVMKVRILALEIDAAAIDGSAGLSVVFTDGVAFEWCKHTDHLVTAWGSRTPVAGVSVGTVGKWRIVGWWRRVLLVHSLHLKTNC